MCILPKVDGQDGVGVKYCGDELVWIAVVAVTVVVVGGAGHDAAAVGGIGTIVAH